jgi:hypothetical protein
MPLIAGKQIQDATITSTQVDTTTGTISTINAGDTAAEGSGAGLSRKDHQHAVACAAAVGITGTNAEGDSSSLARANHTHALTEVQESIDTELITGSDTAMTDTLTTAPRAGSVVKVFLNGVQQEYGAGKDFTVSSQTITWLASTGTAVDMATTDVLVAVYST